MKQLYSLLLISFCYSLFADESTDIKITQQETRSVEDKDSTNTPENQKANRVSEPKQDMQKKSAKNYTQKSSTPSKYSKKIKISTLNQPKEEWKPFLKSSATSLFAGALIGALTGQGSAYTVHHQCNYDSTIKKWAAKFVTWFLWSAARQSILDMLEEEMDKYNIKHNKLLMDTSGMCSDWLSYCYSMYKIYK